VVQSTREPRVADAAKNSRAGNLDFDENKSKYFSTKTGIVNFAQTSKVLGEKK
jgi:hypothetical protein